MRGERLNRIVGYALSRPSVYLVVALTFVAVVLAIIGQWPGWVILASVAGGAALLGLLVLDSLTDPHAEGDAVLADIDPGNVRDRALRTKVVQSVEYVRAAQKLTRLDPDGTLALADEELPQLERAVRSIFQMALRLQDFRADRLVARDLALLQGMRANKGDLTADQQEQLGALQRLAELVRTAEGEIDSALANLGRSYAELQAIKVTPEFRGRVADALQEWESSSKRLSDLARGYDEVYAHQSPPKGPQARG